MMVFALGATLINIKPEQIAEEQRSVVILANTAQARAAMELAEITYEGEISLEDVGFCKIETQQECLAGSLYIPKLRDVLGPRYKILFFINRRHIVIVTDDDFALRLILRIRRRKIQQGKTRELFIYNFITQFMSRDLELLGQYERLLMLIEEKVMNGNIDEFQSEINPIRKELLTLRSYYDELMDMGKQLEENENRFFARKHLKYFGTIADRAERLKGRTAHLLEYAQQVRDSYQTQVEAKQNRNMQFLTVISTIFFPLTLITGWYGMNFEQMKELENGYPFVIVFSLLVVVGCVIYFKRKKML